MSRPNNEPAPDRQEGDREAEGVTNRSIRLSGHEPKSPNSGTAVEFLQKWRPSGPWVLCAFQDDMPPRAARFTVDQLGEMRSWIEEMNGERRNIYFTVNRVKDDLRKKAKKTDVVALDWLHVDVDPDKGKPLQEEQQRILERLQTYLPKPTCVLFSGGGYQAFWRLQDPIEVDGDLAKIEDAERYNRQIAGELGGDNCYNADRIMRVPGTINWPNAKKREAGRERALAEVVIENWDANYPTSGFVRASKEASTKKSGGAARPEVNIPIGDVKRVPPEELLATLEQYGFTEEDAIGRLIIKGHDSEAVPDATKDTSRSAIFLHVCAELVRHGVPDELIHAIVTDEKYGISEHPRNQGRGCGRAVKRAIAKAKADWGGPLGDPIDVTDGRQGVALREVGEQIAVLDLFERGGELVRLVRLGECDEDSDVKRAKGALIVERMDAYALSPVMSRECHFVKHDARAKNGTLRATDPAIDFTRKFLGDRVSWKFRVLAGVTGVPVFTACGEIVTEPGYSEETGLWLDTGGLELPLIPDKPSKENAAVALDVLLRPFRGYPFPNPACRSTLAAALIAPVITPTVDAVPAIGVSASSPAFGKTKIQRALGILAVGVDPAGFNQAASDEENDKRMDAALLAGDPVIAMDNVTRPVGGATLCSIITNPVHKVRVLGRSSLPMVSARVQLTMNGNNLAFFGDMCRRVLMILIEDDDCERPAERVFDFDPVEEVHQQRGAMIAAALTILRAWHCAGRPAPAGHKPLGSFVGWEPVRLALLWLGQADPVDSQSLVYEDDPQREHDRTTLDQLWSVKGYDTFRATDLKDRMLCDGRLTDLGSAFLDAPVWNAKRVGGRLRGLAGRWIEGVRLARVKGDPKKGHVYKVERKDRAAWTDGGAPDEGGDHF